MDAWIKIKEELAYNGWRKIIQKYFVLPNGLTSRYDVVGNQAYVSVAALTKELEFIVIKQYRPGPEAFLLSFPEGYIDPGETPQQTALRELGEETGFTSSSEVVFLKKTQTAYSTETKYCMLLTNCEKQGRQQLDSNEFIDVELIPLKKFRSFLKDPHAPLFTTVDCAYLAMEYLNLL